MHVDLSARVGHAEPHGEGAVLRAMPAGDIGLRHDLEPVGHRRHCVVRHGENRLEDAVDRALRGQGIGRLVLAELVRIEPKWEFPVVRRCALAFVLVALVGEVA